MSAHTVNHVIDRLIRDEDFARRVLAQRGAALREYDLAPEDVEAVVAALERDTSRATEEERYASLRTLARFQPLFAAASASATKSG